jgi:hypothetical protein
MQHLRNSFNHVDAKFDTTLSMVMTCFWNTTDTIVAVAKEFNPQAKVFGGQLVETSKQLVEEANQLFGSTLSRQRGKTAYVGKQNAATKKENNLQCDVKPRGPNLSEYKDSYVLVTNMQHDTTWVTVKKFQKVLDYVGDYFGSV